MNFRQSNNAVKGILIDGSWVDDPAIVKQEVRRFFSNRFREPEKCRPVLDGVKFCGIGQTHNDMLVGAFKEEEIRAAVWECGSEKALARMD